MRKPRPVTTPGLVSRTDRILFPQSGFTKEDAVSYYRAIARYLLPHLKNRPLSFLRFPATVEDESFWEKDIPPFAPAWVQTFPVPRRNEASVIDYVVVNDLRTLVWVADCGGIELHPFLHRAPDIKHATEVVFDLDPGDGADVIDACRVALTLRDHLGGYGLESFAKTSGSKGLQVYVPLNDGKATHEMTEAFASAVAAELARREPERIVAKMAKRLRSGKVFIDWSQNADYKTTVAVYSLRGKRAQPYVSMPLRWDEVTEAAERGDAAALDFTPDAALERVGELGDLFKPLLTLRQSLPSFEERADRRASKRAAPERRTRRVAASGAGEQVIVQGVRLPKRGSQSGSRLFVLPKTETGNELWLDVDGKFKRFILRRDREGDTRLVAMPAGEFPVDPSYFRGEVQAKYRDRVTIEDIGSYERIEGSFRTEAVQLFFTGSRLSGAWRLWKPEPDPKHRSWVLEPVGEAG